MRVVAGIFLDEALGYKPRATALGMWPVWNGTGTPHSYGSPTGFVTYANVAEVPGVKTGWYSPQDAHGNFTGNGFTVDLAIPWESLPPLPMQGGPKQGLQTTANLGGTLQGYTRWWWCENKMAAG